MKSKLPALIATVLLVAGTAMPVLAQASLDPNVNAAIQAQQIRQLQEKTRKQLREAELAMKAYAETHDHFPSNLQEFDECLMKLVRLSDPADISTNGRYRTLKPYAIAVDSSFVGIPVINGTPKVPDNYSGPPSTIVILTDGDKQCVGWAAGENGKPVVLEEGPIYFVAEIADKDAPDKK